MSNFPNNNNNISIWNESSHFGSIFIKLDNINYVMGYVFMVRHKNREDLTRHRIIGRFM